MPVTRRKLYGRGFMTLWNDKERTFEMKICKQIALIVACLVVFTQAANAACTMTPGSRLTASGKYGETITIPLTVTCDESGGAVSDTDIPYMFLSGTQLVEVEIVRGEICDAASVTIENSRGSTVWSISAIEAGSNVYGGHITTGVFPTMDSAWSFSAGDPGASGEFTVYLKMAR